MEMVIVLKMTTETNKNLSRKYEKRLMFMKQYVVDAFTDEVFHGNQAAICIMEKWLPEGLMMNITRENNFSETAFAVREGEKFHLR